jgi:hypothetical protein
MSNVEQQRDALTKALKEQQESFVDRFKTNNKRQIELLQKQVGSQDACLQEIIGTADNQLAEARAETQRAENAVEKQQAEL